MAALSLASEPLVGDVASAFAVPATPVPEYDCRSGRPSATAPILKARLIAMAIADILSLFMVISLIVVKLVWRLYGPTPDVGVATHRHQRLIVWRAPFPGRHACEMERLGYRRCLVEPTRFGNTCKIVSTSVETRPGIRGRGRPVGGEAMQRNRRHSREGCTGSARRSVRCRT